MTEQPKLTVILVPHGTEESRTYRLSYRRLRIFRGLAVAGLLVLLFLIGSWGILAKRSARVGELEVRVAELQAEQSRVPFLVEQLTDLEAQYEHLRSLFAPGAEASPGDLWLPPPGGRRDRTREPAAEEAIPNSWPLAVRGFVTRGRFEGESGGHPGLDIAVPTDSFIRAAGRGTVIATGEDETYGIFVRLDHGNGYETLYGHASRALVQVGEVVRKNEVIALSGSTGQSTAPHLHFELLRNGESVDPLELVTQP
jgi:murein DD-endopeptidase MepM/ murein hydrolase activator NlpD